MFKDDLKLPDEFQQLGFETHLNRETPVEILKSSGQVNRTCLEVVSKIKSVAHRVAGVNNPLGPIVEEQIDGEIPKSPDPSRDRKYLALALQSENVIPTLKHFPFLVKNKDPHLGLTSARVDESLAVELQKNFLVKSGKDYVVMSTHVSSPLIDNGKIVTFSKEWIAGLRKELTDKNLIMTDGLFMLGTYPEQISQATGLSRKIVEAYFKGTKSSVLAPYGYSQDPCFKALRPLLQTSQKGRRLPSIELEREGEVVYKNAGIWGDCGAKLGKYLSFSSPDFDPYEAETIGIEAVAGFVERSLVAGHDLVILEGYPNVAEATHKKLVARACSPGGEDLKRHIQEASKRIEGFKSRNSDALSSHTSEDWFEQNREELNELFFEIYPALNNRNSLCQDSHIERAHDLIRRLHF